jgi:hypothetical protein
VIYHRRALSNELLLRALTETSFFTIRDSIHAVVRQNFRADVFQGAGVLEGLSGSQGANGFRDRRHKRIEIRPSRERPGSPRLP